MTTALVRQLLDTQFPQWSALPLTLLDAAGSDHVIHRLGDKLSVRLPRHAGAIGQAEKEFRWLPLLADHLPLPVPTPVAVGAPDLGYPWPWAVARWLDGEPATVEQLGDSVEAATGLARFLTALQQFTTEGADGDLSGEPLFARDRDTRAAIARTAGTFDAAAMTGLWDAALAAPGRQGPPVWFHGDFHTGNLLTADGRLGAVIDFGGLGVGDPACDLMIAFTLLSAESRAVFRTELGVDEATWLRGRGWALATGLNAYTTYAAVSPRVAAQTTRQIIAALAG
ncbi:aminoglycoside phosphotransferase family protein [Streptomyces sp. TRM66268-LWL]|uniref:Aminoglycoside phosphotransferase family protein n=1 Tax=Streptomyces polyasparticus TaxID=2767826 RepID=A0ABR7SMR4_9ACTN|nr:aminoglycoside phosphotransferase family protein [Streptomyces polyasparticus]MBC9716139.1 aminoglycoside phosphotransferase family protein [Streptomyces polyasparticus]